MKYRFKQFCYDVFKFASFKRGEIMNGYITLEGLLKLLRKNVHILIGWIIGSFAVTALFTFYIIEPQYEATSRIVVNQTENRMSNITSADISTNISLMRTYQNIILEPIILEDVIEETNSKNTLKKMRDKIKFQNDEESLVFGITVTDKDPFMAAEIANSTSEIFQKKIGKILPVNSVTILSEAFPNKTPTSPKVLQNLLFGILLGFLIGFMQIFLRNLLDKRVKSSDIITDLGWINLGSVNEISPRELKETILPAPKKEKKLKTTPRVEKEGLEEVRYVRQTQEKIKANES